MKKKQGGERGNQYTVAKDQNDLLPNTAENIASEHGVSAPTVKRAEKFAKAIDTIGEKLGTEAKQKLLSGEVDATRAVIESAAEIASKASNEGEQVTLDNAITSAKREDALATIALKKPANDNAPQTRLEAFSGDNEWYTPAKYIEMARTVMGSIDVDPASNDYAQNTVKAGKFYTAETNGLNKDWLGNVWINPPYSNPEIQQFIAKAIEEYKSGRCTSAIILTNNSADTGWHHSLQGACTAMCITRGRIRFESPTRESNSPAMGQVFFYFGDDVVSFTKIFSEAGRVWENSK